MGRLYSHFSLRFLQALHKGFPSSHFFLRSRHVKQPSNEVSKKVTSAAVEMSSIPERDLRCSFSATLGLLFGHDFDEGLEEGLRLVLEALVVGFGEASQEAMGGGGEGLLVKGAIAV